MFGRHYAFIVTYAVRYYRTLTYQLQSQPSIAQTLLVSNRRIHSFRAVLMYCVPGMKLSVSIKNNTSFLLCTWLHEQLFRRAFSYIYKLNYQAQTPATCVKKQTPYWQLSGGSTKVWCYGNPVIWELNWGVSSHTQDIFHRPPFNTCN
jgi:hypothetical protein